MFVIEIINFFSLHHYERLIDEATLYFRLSFSFDSKIESFIVKFSFCSLLMNQAFKELFMIYIVSERDYFAGIFLLQNGLGSIEIFSHIYVG